MKKRKLLITLSLVLLLDAVYHLLFAPEQQSLLEEIRGVTVEDSETVTRKELIYTRRPLQLVDTDKKSLKVRLIISSIWLGLMAWLAFMMWMIFDNVQALLPWSIWLSVGLLSALFGIIYHFKRNRK